MIECDYTVNPDLCFDNTMQHCWEAGTPTHYDKKDGIWYINGFRFRISDWSDEAEDQVLTYLSNCSGIIQNLKSAPTVIKEEEKEITE